MVSTFIRIFASLALASLAATAGIKGHQISCYGFDSDGDPGNAGTYNVNMFFLDIPRESISTICGSFSKQVKDCSDKPVNCQTGDQNSVTIGVQAKSRDKGFECVSFAFKQALQADFILQDTNTGCADIPPGFHTIRRAALSKRDNLVAGVTPDPGDFIRLVSGDVLDLFSMDPTGGTTNLEVFDIINTVPSMASALDSVKSSLHSTEIKLQGVTGDLFVSFDRAINEGVQKVARADWSAIVGSMVAYMTSVGSKQARAIFKNRRTGAIVLSVVVGVRGVLV